MESLDWGWLFVRKSDNVFIFREECFERKRLRCKACGRRVSIKPEISSEGLFFKCPSCGVEGGFGRIQPRYLKPEV